ncbi:uncharacterized protein METZ01_LOCUS72385 [marine metagenome]|uniref:Uncharacterized protein n=1 Tax=marine metagenome TaxID=408172 RepID=A0A381TVR8_9ZZZZ
MFIGLKEVLINDNNLKPGHVKLPAMNTEFWVKRDKKECTVVLGESWTYGESLEGIASAKGKYDLDMQLRNCWGTEVATMLDTDYYQYAVPGNNNFYVFTSVHRILKLLSPLYDTVYLLVQMTEPSREDIVINELKGHPLAKLYDREYVQTLTVKDWCVENEDILLTYLKDTIAEFNNVKATVWKNFCTVQNDKDYNFKIIKETWIEYSAKINGFKIESPDFYNVRWLKTFLNDYPVIQKTKYLHEQLDKIQASNKFVNVSQNHCPHPDETAHKVWGLNVYNLMEK